MWRTLFIGWLAIALAEEVAISKDEIMKIAKRQVARGGNTVVYGTSPGQYTIQTPDRASVRAQPQVSADYPQQPELFVISANRKPATIGFSSDSARRPQYIQLSTLQLQAAQQLLQQQHQQIHQHLQNQPARQQVSYDSEPGHGLLYRPAVRLQQQQQQQSQEDKSTRPPVQYAASAIIDSQAGSFERELAQLVAANRAQEQKYNVAAGISAQKKQPGGSQQYLKEVSRPATRPLVPTRVAPAQQPAPLQYQPVQQPQQLYRYVYQPEQLQIQAGPQQYKGGQEQYSIQPQIQQYIHQVQQQSQVQSQAQPQLLSSHATHAPQAQALRLRTEDEGQAQQTTRAHHGLSAARLAASSTGQTEAPPSRSTIYVSQSTPLKKPQYTIQTGERDEEASPAPKQAPAVRLPTQRNRPLTQDEFQNLLQSGGYTATLVPSDDPNSPHQEYLLHPVGHQHQSAQRTAYNTEKQEPVTYLVPQAQQQQRATKRRPVYNVQQA